MVYLPFDNIPEVKLPNLLRIDKTVQDGNILSLKLHKLRFIF